MTEPNKSNAASIARKAADAVGWAEDNTGFSMLELAAMFRVAASTCDETHAIRERAEIASKFRGWKPGG